jgi:hypothetical protein
MKLTDLFEAEAIDIYGTDRSRESFDRMAAGAPKHAAFCFGRMNPPTIGHAELLRKTAEAAMNGEYYIFASKTNDKKDNPLPYRVKLEFLHEMFPEYSSHIVEDEAIKTPLLAADWLYNKGIRAITMVAGSDRLEQYQKLMTSWNSEEIRQKYNREPCIINFVSSGEREDGAEGIAGVSASGARAAAKAGNLDAFKQTTGTDGELATKLFNAVRNGLGLETVTEAKFFTGYRPSNIDDEDDEEGQRSNKRRGTMTAIQAKRKKHDDQWMPSNTPQIIAKVPSWNATFIFTGHFRDQVADRHTNYDAMVADLLVILEKHKNEIQRIPHGKKFLIRDRYRYSTVFFVRHNDSGTTYTATTMLPAIRASEIFDKHQYVFMEADEKPRQLGDIVDMRLGMQDADFWIEYRGSADALGRPGNEYGPKKLGIKVVRTDIVDPKYLYYVFMNLHQRGMFKSMGAGATNLVNLRVDDIKRIPLG